jgi:hypothetical protein
MVSLYKQANNDLECFPISVQGIEIECMYKLCRVSLLSNPCAFIRGICIFRQEGWWGKQDFGRCSGSFWWKSHELKRTKLQVDVSLGTVFYSSCFLIDPYIVSFMPSIHLFSMLYSSYIYMLLMPFSVWFQKAILCTFLKLLTSIYCLICCHH